MLCSLPVIGLFHSPDCIRLFGMQQFQIVGAQCSVECPIIINYYQRLNRASENEACVTPSE